MLEKLWFILKILFVLIYVGSCIFISKLIYKEQMKFYKPLYVSNKSKEETICEGSTNIHDMFEVFSRRDKEPNFLRILFGLLAFGLIKFAVSFTLAIFFSYFLNKVATEKKNNLNHEDIKRMKKVASFWSSVILTTSGLFLKKVHLDEEVVLPIYQKYFGPDYKISYDAKFGGYISNHTSFYDVLILMKYTYSGFISKLGVKNLPVIGKICEGMQSVYVEREKPDSRKDVLDKIVKKQNDFYEGKPVMPLNVFPEGTTTSGRHLLKFKKGAFYSGLPLIPCIIHPNNDPKIHLGCGSSDTSMNYLRSLTEVMNFIEFIELPIMTPNEYMYSNFSNLGSEKWEIYAEVTREIMCELGGFQKSDMTLRDSNRYINSLNQGKYIEPEKSKID